MIRAAAAFIILALLACTVIAAHQHRPFELLIPDPDQPKEIVET